MSLVLSCVNCFVFPLTSVTSQFFCPTPLLHIKCHQFIYYTSVCSVNCLPYIGMTVTGGEPISVSRTVLYTIIHVALELYTSTCLISCVSGVRMANDTSIYSPFHQPVNNLILINVCRLLCVGMCLCVWTDGVLLNVVVRVPVTWNR